MRDLKLQRVKEAGKLLSYTTVGEITDYIINNIPATLTKDEIIILVKRICDKMYSTLEIPSKGDLIKDILSKIPRQDVKSIIDTKLNNLEIPKESILLEKLTKLIPSISIINNLINKAISKITIPTIEEIAKEVKVPVVKVDIDGIVNKVISKLDIPTSDSIAEKVKVPKVDTNKVVDLVISKLDIPTIEDIVSKINIPATKVNKGEIVDLVIAKLDIPTEKELVTYIKTNTPKSISSEEVANKIMDSVVNKVMNSITIPLESDIVSKVLDEIGPLETKEIDLQPRTLPRNPTRTTLLVDIKDGKFKIFLGKKWRTIKFED